MFALLFNLDLSEIAIILIGAILVFGRNLPQVAMRGAAQFVKLRRQLMQVWREAGFEEELRKAQRELEASVPKLPPPKSFFDAQPQPADPGGSGSGAALAAAHSAATQGTDHPGADPDPDRQPDWEEGHYESGPSEEEKRALPPADEVQDAGEPGALGSADPDGGSTPGGAQ